MDPPTHFLCFGDAEVIGHQASLRNKLFTQGHMDISRRKNVIAEVGK